MRGLALKKKFQWRIQEISLQLSLKYKILKDENTSELNDKEKK